MILANTYSKSMCPMHSRLTGCVGYMIDCGNYGMLGFSVRWNLDALCLKTLCVLQYTHYPPALDWKMNRCTLLCDKYWLYNCERCSPIWFSPNYTTYQSKDHGNLYMSASSLFMPYYELSTVHVSWHRHYTSLSSYTNENLLETLTICWPRTYSATLLLNGIRHIGKVFNLIHLARRASHTPLIKGVAICPIIRSHSLPLAKHIVRISRFFKVLKI